MRLNFYILSLILLISSCQGHADFQDKLQILKVINETIPRQLPLPPPPDHEKHKLDSLSQDYGIMEFNYAIYPNYFVLDEDINFSSKFWKERGSQARFGKAEIDSIDYETLKGLLKFEKEETINKRLIENLFKKEILQLNQRVINQMEKKEFGVDGIISFTNIAFSSKRNLAAIGLGVHRGRLDSYFNLYILEKINGNWIIKYFKTKSYS